MYYLGADTTTVKPVTRRTTWTRPMFDQLRKQKYLMKQGRCPQNRRAYPTAGVPVGVHKVPGWGAWQRRVALGLQKKPDAFSAPVRPVGWGAAMRAAIAKQRGFIQRPPAPSAFMTRPTMGHFTDLDLHLDPGRQLSSPIMADMSLEPGGQLGGLLDIFKVPTLTSSFTPAPSLTTASAPAPSFLDRLVTGAFSLWDSRPQVLKDISFKIDPNVAIAAAQKLVSAGQVQKAVDYLRSVGVNPSYLNVPLTGQMAATGYSFAGTNWSQYMPWIIGGGIALVALPLLMGKR